MLKKLHFYSITIIITVLTITSLNSQNLEKKEFNKANTIRIYVKDTTIEQAKERFVDYINKTEFQAIIVKIKNPEPDINNQKSNSFQLNNLDNEPRLMLNKNISGDTITTNIASLYNSMMGQYSARLKFYVSKDKVGKMYIAITGFVSSNAFGIDFVDLKIQKGGKDSNWAQRDLFKNLNRHLLDYSEVYNISYSVE